MKKPRISVIMGVYNLHDYQVGNDAIESILKQTYQDFEIIICDDGSDYVGKRNIERLSKKDNRIRVIENDKNLGLAHSLNRCLEVAQGEFIVRMDIDDISYPERLEKQLDYMMEHKEIDVLGSWAELFDENRGVWGVRRKPEVPEKKDFLFGNPIIHATIIAKHKVLEKEGGYKSSWDTVRFEDFELFSRLLSKGYYLCNMQEPLYQIRENDDAYRRRSYKHRLEEAHVRWNSYKILNLFPIGLLFVIKPIIVGFIPQKILAKFRRESLD